MKLLIDVMHKQGACEQAGRRLRCRLPPLLLLAPAPGWASPDKIVYEMSMTRAIKSPARASGAVASFLMRRGHHLSRRAPSNCRFIPGKGNGFEAFSMRQRKDRCAVISR